MDQVQAPTQYLGKGSSQPTETIQYSLFKSDKPIFLLMVDAQRAFDNVLLQILVRSLFLTGITDSSLCFINNRITSRSTKYKWDKTFTGPAKDLTGVEQGGIPSGDN